MIRTRSQWLRLLLLIVCGAATSPVAGYEAETHRGISLKATSRSSVDLFLRESLGLPEGLLTAIDKNSLTDWVRAGSMHADDWTYFLNHFHNPLAASWFEAGFPFGQSAILWGQNPTQGYPSWSWQNTRQYFLDALTSATKTDRDEALKSTFQGLGHLVHLIQDMASPAHTRNDPHVRYNYESLVRDVQDAQNQTFLDWLNRPYSGPDPGWQALLPNPLAPIPIARLLDTDRYDGTNPEATIQPLMGLAEYTNANFLSEDRIFTEGDPLWRFPYPRRSPPASVTAADYAITLRDGTNVVRQYFRKDFHGDSGYRLATVGVLEDYFQRFALDPNRYRKSPALDEAVYRDYAERLLPRAVGYSAALLDYFFRGKLEAKVAPDPMDAQVLRLTGKNASAEALKDGTLKVYGDYASEGRSELGSWTISGPVAAGGDLPGQPLSFRALTDRPVPERYMVVYQGSLGEEKRDSPPAFGGAVIGKAAKYVGVIEQLFINRADGDVYFRNGTLVTKLNVLSQLRSGSLIFRLQWGTRNDTFLVEGGVPNEGVSFFYAFVLNRPGPDRAFRDPPVATLVRGPELVDPFFPRQQLPPFAEIYLRTDLAHLDSNLDVILHGYYCVDIPSPLQPDRSECRILLVNHSGRTVLFEVSPFDLGAPGPVVNSFSGVFASLVLRLGTDNPSDSRIVVEGVQSIHSDENDDVNRGYLSVVDGNGRVVSTLVNWEIAQSPGYMGYVPQRGGRHLLWEKFDDNEESPPRIYLSSLVDGSSTEIGAGDADVESFQAASLLPVAPDYLVRTISPSYFAKGWTADGGVVLPRVDTPGFPPEDPDLAGMKRLADLPSGVSMASPPRWQVIEDPDLLR